jgi:hypothetical protein
VKVLLDENLDHALRKLLGDHEVVTASHMGWAGVQNGELLRAAEDSGIEVLLTGDQTLRHEQNLAGKQLAILVRHSTSHPERAFAQNDSRDRPGQARILSGSRMRQAKPQDRRRGVVLR